MISDRASALLQAAATIYGVVPDITYERAVDDAYALLGLIAEQEKAQYGSRCVGCGNATCSHGKFCPKEG